MNATIKNEKLFISKTTGTVYYIEVQGDKEYLAGIPISADGTFQLDESFLVEENNTELAEEHIHAPETNNFEQLRDVWAKARRALL